MELEPFPGRMSSKGGASLRDRVCDPVPHKRPTSAIGSI
jgi:hypothetical protein